MRLTGPYEQALRALKHNDDFGIFLQWLGDMAASNNERLIFNTDQDVKVLQGRTQALSEVLRAIDNCYKERK